MTDPDLTMPWKGIAKLSAYAAAITAAAATALCAAGLREERRRAEELARPRWTDAARWEKRGRDY